MSYNSKKILLELVDKYDRSVISKQGTTRNLKQKFNINKTTIKEYFSTEGYKFKVQLNTDLFTYQENGWVELIYDEDSEIISSVTLNISKIEEINEFLNRKSRVDKEKELIQILKEYENSNIGIYVQDVISKINNFEAYQNLVFENESDNKNLLKTLSEIIYLDHEEMERVFSVRVLNDSKLFQKIKSKVIHILKIYYGADGYDEQILADFNIIKNPGYVSLKGNGTISVNDCEIDLSRFGKEFLISSSNLQVMKFIDLPVKRIVTIENLTTFYTIDLPDTLFIYLGGYHNHSRRQLLNLIYDSYPNLDYYHFGDIDAGGIYIYEHLKNKTGIPFKPYLMNVDILKKYKNQTISLTKNDIERLKKVTSLEFVEVIRYMLENNCKLEQENIIEYNLDVFQNNK